MLGDIQIFQWCERKENPRKIPSGGFFMGWRNTFQTEQVRINVR